MPQPQGRQILALVSAGSSLPSALISIGLIAAAVVVVFVRDRRRRR